MKNFYLFIIVSALAFNSCKEKTEIFPKGQWHQDCAAFSSVGDGFQLTNMCCQYLDIPKLEIKKDNSFETTGTYHAFNGSGFTSQAASVFGNLSDDRQKVNVSYVINSQTFSYTMQAGPTDKVACTCGCD